MSWLSSNKRMPFRSMFMIAYTWTANSQCSGGSNAFFNAVSRSSSIHHHRQSVLPKGRSFTARQESRLKFCRRQVFHCKFRNQACSFTTLSLASEQTLKDLDIPGASTWRWGERIWLTGPSGLHRNSPRVLNISSIRVFDQIRDPEIPITLCPHYNTAL